VPTLKSSGDNGFTASLLRIWPARVAARGTDVHKQDHRDRTIPAAVIVVVFFVAILVAALIWLAAS
jgi:hypothetical protein